MKKYLILAFLSIFIFSLLLKAEELFGKCVGVADGDTCTILLDGTEV